ncbi:HEPN domain-containing protein [Candidatus Woesearchaeota archaeon]|nr:HEPN domain-containing protein [Candidatus Woesearchaeota archaeon]
MKKGLLRRIPASKIKAESSLKTAEKWLEEAHKNLDSKAFNSCLLNCYATMFHSARAILFKDGFREKSHACIARYLEHVYVKKNLLEQKWIQLLDHQRELRHQGQYNFTFSATKNECLQALKTAKEFLKEMKKLLK